MGDALVMADVGDVGLLRLKKARRDLRNREMVYGDVKVLDHYLSTDYIVDGLGFSDDQWTATFFEVAITWPDQDSLEAFQMVEQRRGSPVRFVTIYVEGFMVVMGVKPDSRQYPQFGDLIMPPDPGDTEVVIKTYRRHPSNFILCVELGARLYEQLEPGVEIRG